MWTIKIYILVPRVSIKKIKILSDVNSGGTEEEQRHTAFFQP